MGEKERFEVLLEEIRHEVQIIAEGLVSLRTELRTEMQEGFRSIRQDVADLRSDFKLFVKAANQRLSVLETKVK